MVFFRLAMALPVVTFYCEHAYWGEGIPEYFSEPMCSLSGLVMCYLGFKCTAGLENPPLQFCLARASLVVCGLGTTIYHMLDQNFMDKTRINAIMLDGVTMAFVTVNIFLMHLSNWMKKRHMVISVSCMLYLMFWVETNDMLLFTFLSEELVVNGVSVLSIGIQYPLFVVVYVYILIRVAILRNFSEVWPMWLMLVIALVSWGLDRFLCSSVSWFFIGHVIWHVCIGYVAAYLMVLGLMDGDLYEREEHSSIWWVHLTEKKGNDRNLKSHLDVSSFFNS